MCVHPECEVKKVDLFGEWGEFPFERAKGLLARLKGKPTLVVDGWIWVMDPNADLIINVSFEVSEVGSKLLLEFDFKYSIIECGKGGSWWDAHCRSISLKPICVTKAKAVMSHDEIEGVDDGAS